MTWEGRVRRLTQETMAPILLVVVVVVGGGCCGGWPFERVEEFLLDGSRRERFWEQLQSGGGGGGGLGVCLL
jgi:hypothetical protein